MLLDDILREADRDTCTLLVLLDLSAAFDTMNHGTLLDRLSEVGIAGLALSWLKDHLQRIQLKEDVSAPWTLRCGVPQRLALSPMLLNICVKGGHQDFWNTKLYLSITTSAVDAIPILECCSTGMDQG